MSDKPNILYRIYYRNMLMYVGRTHQKLARRLHGHFFGAPMHRKLDLFLVTKIEYAECTSEADMYLYEIYYINKDKPPANCDDRARDDLTIELPDLNWEQYDMRLFDKWKEEIASRDTAFKKKKKAADEAFFRMDALYDRPWISEAAHEEYEKARDEWERLTKEAKIW